ncbi:MAG: hypothetical protein QN173_00160 [Armatimonadota bacterium]|nr:hypothetical protein [Armatimonadota bacterium]MDR7400716.1 hypothetical protein [Armatimonadota bacterium]MDR7403649.1 hypothetical protein [Armatimonadota bacterium]MDR7436473.1 hypothetical protein [Armatimonadota bacterium]MDR7472508.1 hypothetical protein [Armatimonadota bacterium]
MGRRLRLEDVSYEATPTRTRARVQLRNSGVSHVGLATGPAEDGAWARVVAQATVNAVRMYAGFAGAEMRIALDSVQLLPSPSPLVVVTLTLGAGGRELLLAGSAPAGTDPRWAVARAVLQALNRQIEKIAPPDATAAALN